MFTRGWLSTSSRLRRRFLTSVHPRCEYFLRISSTFLWNTNGGDWSIVHGGPPVRSPNYLRNFKSPTLEALSEVYFVNTTPINDCILPKNLVYLYVCRVRIFLAKSWNALSVTFRILDSLSSRALIILIQQYFSVTTADPLRYAHVLWRILTSLNRLSHLETYERIKCCTNSSVCS